MRKIGIVEDVTLLEVAKSLVEFSRRKLRGEDDLLDPVAPRSEGGKPHQGSADPLASRRRRDCHSANLRRAAVTYHAQRPNHPPLVQGDEMGRDRVVGIDLEFLGNPLFDDEHLAAQGIRLAHQRVGPLNGDNLDHGPSLADRLAGVASCCATQGGAPLADRLSSTQPAAAPDFDGARQALQYANRVLPVDAAVGDAAAIDQRHAGDRILPAG